jgi:hypothetical protein
MNPQRFALRLPRGGSAQWSEPVLGLLLQAAFFSGANPAPPQPALRRRILLIC